MGEEASKDAEPSIRPDVVDGRDLIDAAGSLGGPPARRLATNQANNPRSSRNNHSSRANQQASQSRNFEFVLVTDSESRRQVRRHAMRQYMHQRRLDSIARLGTSRAPVSGWTTRSASDPAAADLSPQIKDAQVDSPTKSDRESPSTDEEQCAAQDGQESSRLLIPKSQHIKREEEPSPLMSSFQSSDPRASPGEGGARDPFSSYPIPISHADHELIQHCKFCLPSIHHL